ncbi:AMIN domain-containing protein [Calothrix membranacea FACHB-236]|nr:AMIN domain-containing protein [Calothrix membranacea FACHB-236]
MVKGVRNRQFLQFYKRLFSISLLGISTAILLEAGSSIAQPAAKQIKPPYYPNLPVQPATTNVTGSLARLDNWRFSPEEMQLEFTLSSARTPKYFYLAQPARIVVDLPNTKLGYVPTQQNYSGAIQRVRISQLNANVTRIVLDLAPGNFLDPNQLKLQPASKKNPTRWVLRPTVTGYQNSVKPGSYPQLPSNLPVNPYPLNLPPIPTNYPQPPINQLPISNNQQSPFFTLPPPANNLPSTSNNQQQPFVTVPPLTSNNPSPLPANIPPPVLPNQPVNFNSPAPVISPNFPVPTIPNSPPSIPETQVVEFGQPIPQR